MTKRIKGIVTAVAAIAALATGGAVFAQAQNGTRELSARVGGASIELHVADDGPGFPPEFLARAFERFARADSGRTEDGVGLGLAIVRTIAEAHGGEAGAGNRPEGGSDVWITLPLRRA